MGTYHELQTDKQAIAQAAGRCIGWGAAIIDERGNEVPITDQMIERACEELSRSWTFPRAAATVAC